MKLSSKLFAIDTRPSVPEAQAPSKDRTISDISRRTFLKIGALALLKALTPGCLYNPEQNFDPKKYEKTGEPQRAEIPLGDAQFMPSLTETIQEAFGACPDLSQFFSLRFDGQNIQFDILSNIKKDLGIVETMLKEAGYDNGYMTFSEDLNMIIFYCKKNGRYLSLEINSEGINIQAQAETDANIKSNFVDANIYPLLGNQKKPIALSIDVTRTKIYKNDDNNQSWVKRNINSIRRVIDGNRSKPSIEVGEGIDQKWSVDKTRKVIGGDGSMALWTKGKGYFEFQEAGSDQLFKVHDTKSFLQFLRSCQCTEMIRQVLTTEEPFYDASINRLPFLGDIDSIDTVREILGLIPKDDLDLWYRFINLALQYRDKDRSGKDEYRDPKTSLQSGWADCDDYAVINAFWCYLHGYEPSFVFLELPKDTYAGNHSFIWYKRDDGLIVVMSDNISIILEEGKTVDDFIKKKWPGGKEAQNKQA